MEISKRTEKRSRRNRGGGFSVQARKEKKAGNVTEGGKRQARSGARTVRKKGTESEGVRAIGSGCGKIEGGGFLRVNYRRVLKKRALGGRGSAATNENEQKGGTKQTEGEKEIVRESQMRQERGEKDGE